MIYFRSGHNYHLVKTYVIQTAIRPGRNIETEFIRLTIKGLLTLQSGFSWDGPSKAPDTDNFLRGSAVHDGLYKLMRDGWLHSGWRETADRELQRICIEAGMNRFAAWIVYRAVRIWGGNAVKKDAIKRVRTAP